MKQTGKEILTELKGRYPVLEPCMQEIACAVDILCECYRTGGKLLVCGNGGSASDSLHIVGELMKSFVLPRKPDAATCEALMSTGGEDGPLLCSQLQGALPAIALVNETALQTAYSNDVAPELVFAQQVLGYGVEGDTLIGISTSGNSRNVVLAAKVARAKKMHVITLTGAGGGALKSLSDACVSVPDTETYRIQELHLPVYHALCLALEAEFFGKA